MFPVCRGPNKFGCESANLQPGLHSIFIIIYWHLPSTNVIYNKVIFFLSSWTFEIVLNQLHQRSIWCRKTAHFPTGCCSCGTVHDHSDETVVVRNVWTTGTFTKIAFCLCRLHGGFYMSVHIFPGSVHASGRCSAASLTHSLSAAPEGTKISPWWAFGFS